MNKARKRETVKHRRRPTSEAGRARDMDWNIVLVGQERRLDAMERVLASFEPAILRAASSGELAALVDESTVAVILVEPIGSVSIARAVSTARGALSGSGVSLFAVVADGVRDATVRKLYANGASTVFEWPREALILPQVLAEVIGADRVRGRASESDRALERAIKVYLSVAAGLYRGLRLHAIDGAVSVSGTVSALWQKDEIEEIVANFPGVTSVGIRQLEVAHSGISDRKVGSMVRSVLRNTTEVDEQTLSVSVRNGRVNVAGSVTGRRELWRMLKLISNVRGVRKIENLTVTSARQNKRDATLAGQIREAVATAFAGEEIDISVFGGYVVLRGRVSTLGVKKRAERFIDGDSSVRRVVNKLEVVDLEG